MAEAGEKAIRKKEREPIATVCLVVLLIASVAVLGVFINDNYISSLNIGCSVTHGSSRNDITFFSNSTSLYDSHIDLAA